MDAAFIALMVIFLLLQIPLGSVYLKAAVPVTLYLQTLSAVSVQLSQYAYQIGMSTLGIAGFMLCYTLYKAKLVPRFFGRPGASLDTCIIFVGMVSEIMGSGLGLASLDSGRPVGGVHRGVVDRQRIQSFCIGCQNWEAPLTWQNRLHHGSRQQIRNSILRKVDSGWGLEERRRPGQGQPRSPQAIGIDKFPLISSHH